MKGFSPLPKLLAGARRSRFRLWLLNLLLGRLIPFNRPHGVRIVSLGADQVQTSAPDRRRNHNHLGGIHACCIAAVAEFSSGLLVLSKLNPNRYRLIMARLEIDYHYQAKGTIIAITSLTGDELEQRMLVSTGRRDKEQATLSTEVFDPQKNLVATVRVTWQIKPWARVRTRIS